MAELDDPDRLALIGRAYFEPGEDAVLDAVVTEALTLARAPMAMVSIVGAHTQMFRAHRGLPAGLAVACGTSRSSSFCQLVVRFEEALIVTDAVTDPRVSQELVREYGVRAYLGVPIRRGSAVLGSLCVVDVVPREFPPKTLAGFRKLAERVSRRLREASEQRETRPAFRFSGVADVRVRVEELFAALAIVLPTARRSQLLGASDITGESLTTLRETLREVMDLYAEVVRTADQLDALVHDLDHNALAGEGRRASAARALRRDTDRLTRTLGEIAVMARVAGAFVREDLSATVAARALGVGRDALFAIDALVASVLSLQRTLEAMCAENSGRASPPALTAGDR